MTKTLSIIAGIFFVNLLLGHTISQQKCYLEGERLGEVQQIFQDREGLIWLISTNGVKIFNGREWLPLHFPGKTDNILNISQDKNGNYWFALGPEGYLFYDRINDHATAINSYNNTPLDIRSIEPTLDYRIILTDKKSIYVADETGYIRDVMRFNQASINQNFICSKNDYESLTIWLGGEDGLYRKNYIEDEIRPVTMPFTNTYQEFRKENFPVTALDVHQNLVICGTQGGICIYNNNTGSWKSITLPEFPLNTVINNFIKTNNNSWIFTHKNNNKLAEFHLDHDSISYIPGFDFTTVSTDKGLLMDQQRRLWLNHGDKICSYLLDSLTDNSISGLIIHQLLIEGSRLVPNMGYWDFKNITLAPGEENITIQFSPISYLPPDNFVYQYKLSGINSDWVDAGKNFNINFNISTKGKYNFSARVMDPSTNNYIPSGDLVIYKKVIPVINRNNFFLLLGLIFLVVILLFYLFYNINKKQSDRREADFQASIKELQNLALRSQMNPHFIFNSLNSIRYFIVSKDNQKAADYLTKFSRLIRLILENSKTDLISIEDEIQTLKLYIEMEQVRFDHKFTFQIFTNGIENLRMTKIPPMIIQPFVENAILHGINPKDGHAHLTVTITHNDPLFEIIIQDNGIGRAAASTIKKDASIKKESLGMKITAKRLDLIKNAQDKQFEVIDLYDVNNQPSGTKVIIRFSILPGKNIS